MITISLPANINNVKYAGLLYLVYFLLIASNTTFCTHFERFIATKLANVGKFSVNLHFRKEAIKNVLNAKIRADPCHSSKY